MESELTAQVSEVLERFNELVSTRNMQVLAEFAPGDEILLAGSEAGEVAAGRRELEAFFERAFARETTFLWEWQRIEAFQSGSLAWFFAEGQVILSSAGEQRKSPYRISGVLWRQYHGSEPAGGE